MVIRYSSPLIVIRQNGSSLSSSHSILGIWYLLVCVDSLILLDSIGVYATKMQDDWRSRVPLQDKGVIYSTQFINSIVILILDAWIMHHRNTGTNLAGTGTAHHVVFPEPTSMSPVLGGHECMHEAYEQLNKYHDKLCVIWKWKMRMCRIKMGVK
jgi:hypothetical protein